MVPPVLPNEILYEENTPLSLKTGIQISSVLHFLCVFSDASIAFCHSIWWINFKLVSEYLVYLSRS